jgi:hypothetical protein
VTPQERQRVFELSDQLSETGASIEEIVRSIHGEMPHLTADDLAHAFRVRGEELRLDAAAENADAEASSQIADIIREVAQTSGLDEERVNLEQCLPILHARREQGDVRAVELLERLDKALSIIGVGD